MAEYIEMISGFFPLFGDTFRQQGTCVFANDQFTITLVGEIGVHADSGDGKVDHIWTADLDSEDMEAFWRKNPVEKV